MAQIKVYYRETPTSELIPKSIFAVPESFVPACRQNYSYYCPHCCNAWLLVTYNDVEPADHMAIKRDCMAHSNGVLFTGFNLEILPYVSRFWLERELNLLCEAKLDADGNITIDRK